MRPGLPPCAHSARPVRQRPDRCRSLSRGSRAHGPGAHREGAGCRCSAVTGERAAVTAHDSGGSVELVIRGMTCASCGAGRKKLNKLNGVAATVNFATEMARISHPGTVSPDELIARETGRVHGGRPPAPQAAGRRARRRANGTRGEAGEAASLRRRLLVSLMLTVPVVTLAMVPAADSATGSGSGWRWPGRWRCGGPGHSTAPPLHQCPAWHRDHGYADLGRGRGRHLWSLYALFFVPLGSRACTWVFALPG